MTLLDADLDWRTWFDRWQVQQDCYIPQRQYRFNLMLLLPHLPHDAELHILDLGCGPGTLAFSALEHYPSAYVVAVDLDPVLLAMGQHIANYRTDRIRFLQVDIRNEGWWAVYDGTFDLVLSATALHWLSAENLAGTYRRVYKALKPGGWLMNSDHMASDDPQTQTRYREMLRAKQKTAFSESGADNWDAFWDRLGGELGNLDLLKIRNEEECWEGSDDGQPKQFHFDTSRECGFEKVEFHWQDLGEAVIGARKPLVR